VRLGRALLRDQARLVLLDEPFRGLDRGTRAALLDRARSWWPRATFLCITHDVEQTLAFDQVVVLEGGRIVEAGLPRDLAAQPAGPYRSLLDREAAVRRRFQSGHGWRRLRITHGGRIEETP
jgi:ATP-binding cassette subfamily B protein